MGQKMIGAKLKFSGLKLKFSWAKFDQCFYLLVDTVICSLTIPFIGQLVAVSMWSIRRVSVLQFLIFIQFCVLFQVKRWNTKISNWIILWFNVVWTNSGNFCKCISKVMLSSTFCAKSILKHEVTKQYYF